jgi:hypothetical protein
MPAGHLRERIGQLIAGKAPADPLYLSNRTWRQKLKLFSLVGAPVLILIALVTIAATDVFRLHRVDPYEHPLAESLPASPQKRVADSKLGPADLEVVNLRISKDGREPIVTGVVRNNTDKKVTVAEISYYLADSGGSLVGTDTADVQNVAPHGDVAFRVPLKISKAAFAFIRDVHTN